MNQKPFKNKFFRMARQLSELDYDNRPIKAFNILQKHMDKLKKFSAEITKDFPKICRFDSDSILLKNSYHFVNKEESIDFFIAIIKCPYTGVDAVKIVIDCYDINKDSPMRMGMQEFHLVNQ